MNSQNDLSLELARKEDLIPFKNNLQRTFTKRMNEFLKVQAGEALPSDEEFWEIVDSKRAIVYKIIYQEQQIGGVVLSINEETQRNAVDFFFVDPLYQDKHIGSTVWCMIEERYPNTRVWETYTPYFDQRNIHFYVNKCGFYIVEYFCEYHKEKELSTDKEDEVEKMLDESFFRFEKWQ